MTVITCADRARRFEAALRAYIETSGDDIRANEPNTWLGDLLCDAHHWCERMKIPLPLPDKDIIYNMERDEDPKGRWARSKDWLK